MVWLNLVRRGKQRRGKPWYGDGRCDVIRLGQVWQSYSLCGQGWVRRDGVVLGVASFGETWLYRAVHGVAMSGGAW